MMIDKDKVELSAGNIHAAQIKVNDRTILDDASAAIYSDRRTAYGEAERSFNLIAEYWSSYLGGTEISPLDVANMMILLKIARTGNVDQRTYHRDNYVDIAGYAGLGDELK